jgi:hypothetical protein
VTLDFDRYEKVGGTNAGAYLQIEHGILLAVPKEGYRQTVEGARASLREQERLATALGEPQVVLILVDRVQDQDAASRRIWRDEAQPEYLMGIGLVGVRPLAKAIGAFFIGLTKPRVPTALFATLEDGIQWARHLRQETHAGR